MTYHSFPGPKPALAGHPLVEPGFDRLQEPGSRLGVRGGRRKLTFPHRVILPGPSQAACAFGQEDDITVLSIRRLAAAEEPAEARMNLTAQIAAV